MWMTSWIAVTSRAGRGSEFSSSGVKLEMLSLKLKAFPVAFVPLNMATFITYNFSSKTIPITFLTSFSTCSRPTGLSPFTSPLSIANSNEPG